MQPTVSFLFRRLMTVLRRKQKKEIGAAGILGVGYLVAVTWLSPLKNERHRTPHSKTKYPAFGYYHPNLRLSLFSLQSQHPPSINDCTPLNAYHFISFPSHFISHRQINTKP
ncbi:hypothetical protein VNO77_11432 [Canavalia gladiata]|uniref:Uncharacterized protein n=1 Tax=Canavalia gladiata TaxID=3824 RepID=A0AAN9MH14_CANGL